MHNITRCTPTVREGISFTYTGFNHLIACNPTTSPILSR